MYNISEKELKYLEHIIGRQVNHYKVVYPYKLDELWSLGYFAIGKACHLYDGENNPNVKFTTYATTAIINEIRHWHRKEKHTICNAYLDEPVSDNGNLHDVISLKDAEGNNSYNGLEIKLDLHKAMKKLTNEQCKVIELKLEGYTNLEIAEILNLSYRQVTRRAEDAYSTIRKQIRR